MTDKLLTPLIHCSGAASLKRRVSLCSTQNHYLNTTTIIGRERTEQQDVEFPINQLVEVALRAISSAVNDLFTAIRCIDRLGASLAQLVQRNFLSPYRYDDRGNLRVIAERVTFEELVDSAFSQIRRYAQSDAAVTIRLLDAIALILTHTNNPKHQVILQLPR